MVSTYTERRGEIKAYFDRTAADAWARLTSDAPVSRIRATVRAGRDQMRATLLGWLPSDLAGARILDAGCGTGAIAVALAQRGADVVAIDLSPTLVGIAGERLPVGLGPGTVRFAAGDMLDARLGAFDYVVSMDSIIHYQAHDAVAALTGLASRTRVGIVFTFAPKTLPLTLLHNAGKLFPRGDRAPSIVPVGEGALRRLLDCTALADWEARRTQRIASGFYKSQALELVHR